MLFQIITVQATFPLICNNPLKFARLDNRLNCISCTTTVTNSFNGSEHFMLHTVVNGAYLIESHYFPKWSFAKIN